MIGFFIRRVLQTIPTLFLLSVLVFALFEFIPGDYLTEMELNPSVSRETVQALRQEYGLEQPLYWRYFLWIKELFQGNLGYSFAQQRPAFDLILERSVKTLLLSVSVLVLTVMISFPMGIVSALKPNSWLDKCVLIMSLIGLSVPSVLAGVLFLFLAFHSGWFPLGGDGGLVHLVLPSLTLALPTSAFFIRNLRLEMIDALEERFVLAAAARGLPPYRVIFHALRQALNPLISATGVLFGGLLSGAVVVEKIFAWPGLGALVVDSILSRDFFVVLNSILISALLIVAVNLLADLCLAWNDPRIRYQ